MGFSLIGVLFLTILVNSFDLDKLESKDTGYYLLIFGSLLSTLAISNF